MDSIDSTVARVAVRDPAAGWNVIGGNQRLAERFLVGNRMLGRGILLLYLVINRVIHVEDLIARAKVIFGIAMALQTPAHLQAGGLKHQRHLIHAAVAGGAADAFIDVDIVGEIDEIRQIVHARPVNGNLIPPAFSHRFEKLGIGPDAGMASHASLGGGKPRESGIRHRGMAIPAIEAEISYMMRMTEWYRLVADNTLIGDIRRAIKQ
jgi:hypothetical protein